MASIYGSKIDAWLVAVLAPAVREKEAFLHDLEAKRAGAA